MKFRMLLVAAAMLMFAATSFGQAWTLILYETDTPLTTTCGGAVPIAEGQGYIALYVDVDSDGPDATDPLAPDGGGFGRLFVNVRPMNEGGGGPGLFYTDPAFQTEAAPLPISRVYVRVGYPTIQNPTVVYTSNEIWTPGPGANLDAEVTWTCVDLVAPCTQTPSVNLTPSAPIGAQHGVEACFDVCANGGPIPVCVGPLVRENRYVTTSFVNEGCTDCVFAPVLLGGPWVWTVVPGVGGFYCNTIIQAGTAPIDGCGHIRLDFIEPVALSAFTATPSDGEVIVAWTTGSESGLNVFEVMRDGEKVFEVAANNTPDGASYKFVDESAENGRTYSYELVAVNADGSRESLRTASATPSYDAAVITEYALHQNFPNPFNPTTNITFDLVDANDVTITVYNAMGQQVATLLSGATRTAGRHTLSFDATNLTSGLYFYTIKAGNDFTATKKMLLVK